MRSKVIFGAWYKCTCQNYISCVTMTMTLITLCVELNEIKYFFNNSENNLRAVGVNISN